MEALDSKQRILRRLYFMENFDYMYKEMMYGRKFHEELSRPGVVIWRYDDEEGKNADPL